MHWGLMRERGTGVQREAGSGDLQREGDSEGIWWTGGESQGLDISKKSKDNRRKGDMVVDPVYQYSFDTF